MESVYIICTLFVPAIALDLYAYENHVFIYVYIIIYTYIYICIFNYIYIFIFNCIYIL